MPSPLTGLSFDAFLFDMDGTILTSLKAAERVWTAWAVRHGLDVPSFLPTIHGVQASETIRRLNLPGVDPQAEAALITQNEVDDVDGIEPIAGASAFLRALPPTRWAIVTSAPRRLALRRLEAAGLPVPQVLVTAEDVQHGKPAPDCFLLAADRLGVEIRTCLVFEDSPAGIASGQAAGAHLLVVTATHDHPLATPHATIPSYDALRPTQSEAGTLGLAQSG